MYYKICLTTNNYTNFNALVLKLGSGFYMKEDALCYHVCSNNISKTSVKYPLFNAKSGEGSYICIIADNFTKVDGITLVEGLSPCDSG